MVESAAVRGSGVSLHPRAEVTDQ